MGSSKITNSLIGFRLNEFRKFIKELGGVFIHLVPISSFKVFIEIEICLICKYFLRDHGIKS